MLVQTDPRWSDIPIAGDVTIGKEGCLLVCLCNANNLLGNPINPDQLARQLSKAGGFREDGDLLWVKLRETSSVLWMFTGNGEFVQGLQLVEYLRPRGSSHFVLEYMGREYDPKPGTERFGVKSVRQLALIG